jgi:hypothetical protein
LITSLRAKKIGSVNKLQLWTEIWSAKLLEFLKGKNRMDRFPPAMQRPALLEFAAGMGSRDGALRRDECGDWSIVGQFGHVYAFAARRFQFFIMGWSTKG